MTALGAPRLHLRRTDSTNARARELAAAGAPHGMLITAAEQTAGRGRQGRGWSAPPNSSLLMSLVLREPARLASLAAGVAVAAVVASARHESATVGVKWPNDVLLDGRKVAGILLEGRPQERWAVLGIGLNVAVRVEQLPSELQSTAGTLGLASAAIEPLLARTLVELERWLEAPDESLLAALRARDALRGQPVSWSGGAGTATGIDAVGRLRVSTSAGEVALDAGEVHLRPGA